MKNNNILFFLSKYWQIILVSFIFLSYQLYISFTLWNRTGNIPPGFGDSLSYIFGIEKVIKYHSLFPQIPYLGNYQLQPAHLSYISYNLILGLIGIFFKTSGYHVFLYSFFIGKLILLLSCIYLIKNLVTNTNNILAFSLLCLGLFVGDGGIHGFFWVVPSFWMLTLFFFLIGIINSSKKIKKLPVFFLCLLYITIHPLSIFSIFIFSTYTSILFLFTKNIPKKSLIVTISLVISAIIWQIFVFGISNFNKHIKTPATTPTITVLNQTISGIKNASDNVETNSVLYVATNIKKDTIVQQISNSAPSLPQIRIFDELLSISSNTTSTKGTSLIPAWNSYFSWFFRLPFLLVLLIIGFYILIRKKKWEIISLYLSCLSFTLISLINPLGYRSILFLFPVTIIFLANTIYYIVTFLHKSQFKFNKIVIYLLYLTTSLSLIGYAYYGIKTVKYYSTIADYKVNSSKCIEYINKFKPQNTQILFTSIEGINYFLNQNIEQYYISGINNFNPKYTKEKTLLITENNTKIHKSDEIDMTLNTSSNLLIKVKNNINNILNINCDIFELFDITNIVSNKPAQP